MALFRRLAPRTLLVRTFLLVSLLIVVSLATWLTLFGLAEREPRARQVAQLAVSVVNLTNAGLVAADPVKRLSLLKDLAESEGVRLYPAEATDTIEPLPDTFFFRIMRDTALAQLGANTRFATAVNGEPGLWVSFSIDNAGDDEYWLMLPGEHTETDFPWYWFGWGFASLALALTITWLIVSRVTQPLRALAVAAGEVGRGRHPAPVPERGALELRQLAEAFNHMSEDLKRIDVERAEVLAGISHDLRTPLARLRLESEMSISNDEARAGVIDDIEQMDAIIAQFLEYARGSSGERAELTDVNALVAQVAGTYGRTSGDVRLEQGALPPALIHRKALTRALTNLLENARKYAGGEVTVATRPAGTEIVIDVQDRGPGIPESEVERLKRPFTRLENARTDTTGTGLGLAIVERFAQLHDGRLELLPRDGGGLIARLRLPFRNRA